MLSKHRNIIFLNESRFPKKLTKSYFKKPLKYTSSHNSISAQDQFFKLKFSFKNLIDFGCSYIDINKRQYSTYLFDNYYDSSWIIGFIFQSHVKFNGVNKVLLLLLWFHYYHTFDLHLQVPDNTFMHLYVMTLCVSAGPHDIFYLQKMFLIERMLQF